MKIILMFVWQRTIPGTLRTSNHMPLQDWIDRLGDAELESNVKQKQRPYSKWDAKCWWKLETRRGVWGADAYKFPNMHMQYMTRHRTQTKQETYSVRCLVVLPLCIHFVLFYFIRHLFWSPRYYLFTVDFISIFT